MLQIPRHFRDKFHELSFFAYFQRGRSVRKRYTFRAHSGKQETRRRWLQGMHENQRNCHRSGAVQPRHIFGEA